LVEGEEPAEGADVGEDAGRERLADEALDAAGGLLAGLDVYAGGSVRGGQGGRSEGAGKVRVRERRNAGAGGDARLPFSPFLPLPPSLPGRLRLAEERGHAGAAVVGGAGEGVEAGGVRERLREPHPRHVGQEP